MFGEKEHAERPGCLEGESRFGAEIQGREQTAHEPFMACPGDHGGIVGAVTDGRRIYGEAAMFGFGVQAIPEAAVGSDAPRQKKGVDRIFVESFQRFSHQRLDDCLLERSEDMFEVASDEILSLFPGIYHDRCFETGE